MTLYPIPNVPDSLAREIYAALLRSLPPPHDGTQEARDARDARAMAAIAALIPENAAEAELAVDAVATDFHAKHALAAASHPNLPIEALKNCRAMVASMLRQSHATIRTLRQLQIDRRKLEDARYPAAMERAGYYFKDVSVMERRPTTRTTARTRLRGHGRSRAVRRPLPPPCRGNSCLRWRAAQLRLLPARA